MRIGRRLKIRTLSGTGLDPKQLEEDSVVQCVEVLRAAGSPLLWDKTVPAKVATAIQSLQQNVARSIQVINESTEHAARHMERAVQLDDSSLPADGVDRDWTSAAHAVRSNTEIIHQSHARMLESWSQLAAENRGVNWRRKIMESIGGGSRRPHRRHVGGNRSRERIVSAAA